MLKDPRAAVRREMDASLEKAQLSSDDRQDLASFFEAGYLGVRRIEISYRFTLSPKGDRDGEQLYFKEVFDDPSARCFGNIMNSIGSSRETLPEHPTDD